MGIVFACIAPHAAEAIPQLAGKKLKAFSTTRQGMREMAKLMRQQRVETIIIATPHNVRLGKHIGVITSEFSEGVVKTESGAVKIRIQCNRPLATEILEMAENAGLPVIGVNYGTNEGSFSCIPMDWGTLIPLWFFGSETMSPQVAMVTPAREIQMRDLVEFGTLVAQAAENLGKRTAFVASADQAHTHHSEGPYGFHPMSARFDQLVKNAVERNGLDELLSLEPQLIDSAKPDSLWQIAILIGVLRKVQLKGRLVSYQAPTYFGVLCAAYTKP